MRVGIFQSAGGGLTRGERLAKVDAVLAGTDLDLLVCVELLTCGYYSGNDVVDLAEAADGPSIQEMAQIAKAHQTAIVFGYPEAADGTLFNSAAVVDKTGLQLANHRKLALPQSFETSTFQRGDRHTTFQLDGVKIGVLICYDVEFPENTRALAQAGVSLVVVPTALGAEWSVVAQKTVPARAFENGFFVAYANHAGSEGGNAYAGQSVIAGPDGEDCARAGTGEELIKATLDFTQIDRSRTAVPYLQDLDALPKS
jgi:predicted amidohydrolase